MGITGQLDALIVIGDVAVSGPVLISRSLAVACLLGTDFLRRMPVKILVDQGCLEMPSGRKLYFLPSPLLRSPPGTAVQALVDIKVEIPLGSQMLVPLRYRKGIGCVDPKAGILLTPSNSATRGLALFGAQTIIRSEQVPFLQVLNGGADVVIVPAGTVLAHTTTVFSDHDEVEPRRLVGAAQPCHVPDE